MRLPVGSAIGDRMQTMVSTYSPGVTFTAPGAKSNSSHGLSSSAQVISREGDARNSTISTILGFES